MELTKVKCNCNHYKLPHEKHKKSYISTLSVQSNKIVCTRCSQELTDSEYDDLIKTLHTKNH